MLDQKTIAEYFSERTYSVPDDPSAPSKGGSVYPLPDSGYFECQGGWYYVNPTAEQITMLEIMLRFTHDQVLNAKESLKKKVIERLFPEQEDKKSY